LTNATGFFFERDERLYLVTCGHVMLDELSQHFPDRIEIEFHTNAGNLAESTAFSIPLYQDGKSVWLQGEDSGGGVDGAVIEVQRSALPSQSVYCAFTKNHLLSPPAAVGSSLLVIGFPLGFSTRSSHLVARRRGRLAVGSALSGWGILSYGCAHALGIDGARSSCAVRSPPKNKAISWVLLGCIGPFDMRSRDR
jgi:hypothetical protein